MQRILLPILALGLASFAPLAAGEKTSKSETQKIFDGKTLDGWKAEGKSTYPDPKNKKKQVPIWTVENGNIECAGGGFGFLRYAKREFADFHFHVEYSMANKTGRNNSGIGIRTVPFDPKRSRDTRPSFACYEIQLLNDVGAKPTAHSTGSLYRYVAPKTNVIKPAPEWNAVDIICTGPRIRVMMNGTEIVDFDQTSMDRVKNNPLKGYVCLQNHGSRIAFRNIWIREIKGNSP